MHTITSKTFGGCLDGSLTYGLVQRIGETARPRELVGDSLVLDLRSLSGEILQLLEQIESPEPFQEPSRRF